jgi:hypothetical protein
MTFCAWLAVVGALLEIFGFALIATELLRAQWRELGTAGPFQFLVDVTRWIKRKYRKFFGKSVTHTVSVAAGTATATGRASARLGTEKTDPKERLRVLEENFKALDQEVTRHRAELDERIGKEAKVLRTALTALEIRTQAREEEDKQAFRASASLQWTGIGFFVLGAGVSAAANIVSCS